MTGWVFCAHAADYPHDILGSHSLYAGSCDDAAAPRRCDTASLFFPLNDTSIVEPGIYLLI